MYKDLIQWSHREYGHLPWRQKRTLYRTLVSEIMLQQTTVSTVLNHFDRFLKVFPTIQSLAKASEEEVCAQWQGLGYYRRARNLRKAAVAIVEEHGGAFPQTVEELKKIPGIGDYTANALKAIGRDKPALAVDANLERVIARLFLLEEQKGLPLQKAIYQSFEAGTFDKLFKKFGARDLNEAYMDLGRVYCQARRVDCLICPLNKECQTFQEGKNPLELPFQKEKKKKEAFELDLLRVIVTKKDQVLGQVKTEDEWLSGQIEIPTFILKSEDKRLAQYPRLKLSSKKVTDLPVIKTGITKYKIKNYLLSVSFKEFQELIQGVEGRPRYKYFKLNGQTNHFSTTTLKSLKKLDFEV